MQDPKSLQSVAEFHKTFKHPILESPQIPDDKRCKLRVSLLVEELNELVEGIKSKDIVEVADAFCDLQYVLSGAILEFGLADKFKEMFEEVQRSNMSKACNNELEAKDTVAHYKLEKGVDCYYEEADGKYLVFRREDRKTLKSIYYSEANLNRILDKK
ncbi:pyrophosphohydrolase domain-containing protein [Peijinzhouia sedimentorum]